MTKPTVRLKDDHIILKLGSETCELIVTDGMTDDATHFAHDNSKSYPRSFRQTAQKITGRISMNKMTNEDIMNYQKNNAAFRQTKIGKLFATYVSKQQRAERLDAQMEYTDHYRYEKKLTEYWDEAKAAEVELLVELYKIEGLEYARL